MVGLAAAAARTARDSRTCGSSSSASARRRCARARPKPRFAGGRHRCRRRCARRRSRSARRRTGHRRGKQHLAGVLLRRVGASTRGGAIMSESAFDIAVTVNGEHVRERVDARPTLVDFVRETLVAHRQPCRLRARRVRRLHGARRRRDRARLPDARRAVRRRDASKRSKACRIPARSPTCRRPSSNATRCNAASAPQACC